ncbi:MAG: replicative DNA helicase [Verrucomicrobia bacterium]|nr:replicative DNA helicase [Verrucomicrobiota bacterium]
MTEPQQLPNALDMERSILSSMMQDEAETYLDRSADQGITPDTFYVPAHGLLYRVLQEIRAERRPIEPMEIVQRLQDAGKLDAIGGPSYLMEIRGHSPTPAYFDHHLATVKGKHVQRIAISGLSDAIGELYAAGTDDVERILSDASQAILGALNGLDTETGDFSVKDLMRAFVERAIRASEGKSTETIPLPWSHLNDMLGGGLGIGEITVVAGRPSKGKTAFGLQIAIRAAQDAFPSHFLSIESHQDKVGNRIAAAHGAGDVADLSKGNITKGHLETIHRAVKRAADLPMRVRKFNAPTAHKISAAIRKSVRDHGTKLFVLDYLQIIQAADASEARDMRLRMNNSLATICPLASELGISLVILAQLSREAEGKTAIDLHMGTLKETSKIEEDADCIMLIGDAHDHEGNSEDDEPRVVSIPKNRDGPTSFARLQFNGPTTTFHQ